MAIKVGGTTVIDDSRSLSNIASVDAATVTALSAAGVGGGGGSFDIQMTGSIAAGKAVALESNGTFTPAGAQPATSVVMNSQSYEDIISSSDQANLMVSVYVPTHDYFAAIYANVSNSDRIAYTTYRISGDDATTTKVNSSTGYGDNLVLSDHLEAVFDPDSGKIIVIGRYITSLYYTVLTPNANGTLSPGEYFASFTTGVDPSLTYDSYNQKYVVQYRNPSNSYNPYYIVGSISGNNITWGSATSMSSVVSHDENKDITFDSTNNKVIFAYRDSSDSDLPKIISGTVSGTSISWGTATTVISGATSQEATVAYDSINDNVIFFGRGTSGLQAVAATVSGTGFTVGSPISISTGNGTVNGIDVDVDPSSGSIVFIYRNNSNDELRVRMSSVSSGNTLNTPTSSVRLQNFGASVARVTASNGYFLALWRAASNDRGYRWAGVSASSNSSNFLGVSAEAISSGSTGEVTVVGGVNENVSGLTAGATYYLDKSGSFSTSSSGTLVGRALAADKLLVTGTGS